MLTTTWEGRQAETGIVRALAGSQGASEGIRQRFPLLLLRWGVAGAKAGSAEYQLLLAPQPHPLVQGTTCPTLHGSPGYYHHFSDEKN